MNTTNTCDIDRAIYELGKRYLLGHTNKGISDEVLSQYLSGTDCPHLPTINAIYKHMLEAAQTANMKPGVIGKSIGGVKELGRVLSNFQVESVIATFSSPEMLLDRIEDALKPVGKIRRSPRSIWPRYCKTILGSAAFLAEFASAEEFYRWCDQFVNDKRSRLALPLLLSKEIPGLGFALSCEFLKEIGYLEYGKPDIHLKDILKGIGISKDKDSDYAVLKIIIRISENAQVTPFAVDKVLWLIGSGYFHLHKKTIGEEGRIGSMKKDFINYAKKTMRQRGLIAASKRR